MPRIPPSALRRAFRASPHAATLLPTCRELQSALNELRWIREHVAQQHRPGSKTAELHVASLCRRRGRGEPLQYVLGTQPFGSLEILCRPGVLIPRPEPEAYTAHLAHLITTNSLPHLLPASDSNNTSSSSLTIADLCTGTGCIALLLHALLASHHTTIPRLHIHGIDISPHAVQLAMDNLRANIAAKRIVPPNEASPSSSSSSSFSSSTSLPSSSLRSLGFSVGDIFASDEEGTADDGNGNGLSWRSQEGWDILICNPPYVSSWGFAHQTERSVRKYEPKLAQVPTITSYPGQHYHRPEDVFYARLLDLGARRRARVMLFEVGDLAQAVRVVGMVLGHSRLRSGGRGDVVVEVWRDWPDAAPLEDEEETCRVVAVGGEESREVKIRGSGHGRSVFIQCI